MLVKWQKTGRSNAVRRERAWSGNSKQRLVVEWCRGQTDSNCESIRKPQVIWSFLQQIICGKHIKNIKFAGGYHSHPYLYHSLKIWPIGDCILRNDPPISCLNDWQRKRSIRQEIKISRKRFFFHVSCTIFADLPCSYEHYFQNLFICTGWRVFAFFNLLVNISCIVMSSVWLCNRFICYV